MNDADAPPANVRTPGPEEPMVKLLRTGDHIRGNLLKSLLIDHDIWCFVTGDNNAMGLEGAGLSEVTLLVPENDLSEAQRLVAEADAEHEAHSDDPDD